MYRQSLKYSKALRANLCGKSLVTAPKCPITSHHVTSPQSLEVEQKKNMYNLLGSRQATTAFVTLNRDHKYNTFSEGVITDLKRFLESYEVDDLVNAVWLQNQGTTFSKGMDMKSILHNVSNKKQHDAYQYLRQVYDFSMFLGSYMKPLIVLLDGEIANSSASMFAIRPHVITTPNTKWSLNETSFGYVTDSGASYYLSRIPFEMGTYLALTGKTLSGKDMHSLKLAYNHLETSPIKLRREFTHLSATTERLTNSYDIYGDRYEDVRELRKLQMNHMHTNSDKEFYYRVNQKGENPKLVLAEMKYRQELLTHSNKNFGHTNPHNRLGFDEQPLLNHTRFFEEKVLDEVDIKEDDEVLPTLPFEVINRCFSGSTMEEIFNALEEENTEWARETLKQLKTKSPMSLKLTLKLIREGTKSQWGECLAREYRVACRRINDEEFKKATEARLVNREKQFADWTHKNLKDITPDMVDKYFAPLDLDLKVEEYQPTLPENAFSPVKDYYKGYPDTVRYWLNKQTIKDPELRQNYLFDVKTFLYMYGIDIHNPNLNVDLVREKLFKLETFSRRLGLQNDRLMEIARTKDDIQKYFNARRDHIDKFFADTKKADTAIQNIVLELFEQKFEENQKKKEEFASNARRMEKNDTFHKIKSSLIKNRLIQSEINAKEPNNRNEALAENANIPLFFPANSYESFLDVPNPTLSAVHPYAKYMKDVKVSKKVDPEHYEAYMKGLISEDEITKYTLEGDHKGEKIPPVYNLGNSLSSLVERDLKLEREVKDYLTLFGEDPIETARKDNLQKEALKLLTQKSEEINQLLEGDKKLKKYVLEAVKKGTLDSGIEGVEVTAENLIPPRTVPVADEEGLKLAEKITKGSLDTIFKTTNFIDLEPETLKQNGTPLKSIVADPENIKQTAEAGYEKQLLNMIDLDEKLAQYLNPLFKPRQETAANKAFADRLKDMLVEIYTRKVNSLLGQEREKFENVEPLFTKDGKEVLHSKNIGGTDQLFMETIDDYLSKNVNFEFNRYISSHVFFAFSYFALLELEKMYHTLSQVLISARRNRSDGEDFGLVTRLLREKHIKISNKEELNNFLHFLNSMSSNVCGLFYTYKDQLHFTEDILLEKYVKIKYTVSRYNANLRNRKNFINTVLENFKDQHLLQQEIEQGRGSIFFNEENPQPNEEAYKLALTKPGEIKNFDEEAFTSALTATQAYFMGAKNVQRFIPGSFKYLVDLEVAAKKAIYGKYNAFPEDFDFKEKDLEIPDYFENFDIREPLPVWFERKLKEVVGHYLAERSKFQDVVSKEDLIALDHDLMKLLNPANIKEAVMTSLEKDIGVLNFYSESFELAETSYTNLAFQLTKAPNIQSHFNKAIKNPEALNKYMAFALSMYEKYKNKKHKNMNTVLLTLRSEMMDRMFLEAFEETKPTPSMDEFTKGKTVNKEESERLSNIEELKLLRDNDISYDTSLALRTILEEHQEKEHRQPHLRAELEYFFRRHDMA